VTPVSRRASRTIGWCSSSRLDTRSIFEYLTMRSCTNVWWSVMYTYLSMAAAIRNPPWRA
jgi:hypothetical protein